MDRLRGSPPSEKVATFKYTNESGLTQTEGELYLIQETVGVLYLDIQYDSDGAKAAKTIEDGDEGVLIYNAEKILLDKAATTGSAFSPGDKVFWPGTPGANVTNTWQSGYYWIGVCVKAASDTDTTVMTDLKGDKATLTDPI